MARIASLVKAHEPEHLTRAEKLAAELADAILSGAFAPGVHLDEQSLAERYCVSRTPVREALRQLASSGLIEMHARRGAFVTSVTSEALNALFVAMGEIEATCARLSAIGMNPIERRRLKALHESMEALVRQDAEPDYADANREFHCAIYAGAHNSVLIDFALALRRRLDPFRRAQFRAPGRLLRSHQEHDAVVSAILAGQAEAAHASMLDHVHSVGDTFERLKTDAGLLTV